MRCSAKVRPLAAFGPPNCPEASALSHFSIRTGTRLCLLHRLPIPDSNRRPSFSRRSSATELIGITSHFDVRAPVASPPFGPRNTTRRLSFTYRLLDREPGRRLLTGTPEPCTRALARKARTAAHYPLPLTVDDVGAAGCTATWSFAGLHSRQSRCVSRATSAHRLAAIPAVFATRTRGPGLPGSTEPESPAGRHGLRPFPAVTGGYRRQAASHRAGRSRSSEIWWRIAGSNRGPPGCKPGILPTELIPRKLAGTAGLEPASFRLTAERSTVELHAKWWIGKDLNLRRAGLQPAALPAELPIRIWWRGQESNLQSPKGAWVTARVSRQ